VKKFLLSSLSLFVYLLLLFSFTVYILDINKVEKKEQKPLPKVTTQKKVEIEQPSLSIVPKEKDLINIDFDARLLELEAKVGDPVFIRIFKEESMLEVWIKPAHEYVIFKQYPICAFSGHLGPKFKEGDRQSPEGFYTVKKSQLNPNSSYHLAFNLGFPNAYDKAHKRTGSYLMVHGECVSIGCYAMTNSKIDEIYKLVEEALKSGQKYIQVHAFPFRMTDINMAKYADNEWYDFWTELQEGYNYFESEKLPPHVTVQNKRYTIHEANE